MKKGTLRIAAAAVFFGGLLLFSLTLLREEAENIIEEQAAESPAVTATPTASPTPAPTATPEPTPTPTPEPTPTPTPRGILDASRDEYFSLTETVSEDLVYRDSMTSITVTRVSDKSRTGNSLVYYAADIWLQDPTDLRRGMTKEGTISGCRSRNAVSLANLNGAILAMNGDYLTTKDRAICIRDGVLVYDRKRYQYDTCVLYTDGRIACYSPEELDPEKLLQEGAWQTWSFGPTLLDGNGTPLTKFRLPANIAGRNPRAVLGYYEPGHYCMVLVDGRQRGYSIGLNMKELAKLMSDMGCVQAYNLDGGMSAQMVMNGRRVNRRCGDRSIRDLLYIAPHTEKVIPTPVPTATPAVTGTPFPAPALTPKALTENGEKTGGAGE